MAKKKEDAETTEKKPKATSRRKAKAEEVRKVGEEIGVR